MMAALVAVLLLLALAPISLETSPRGRQAFKVAQHKKVAAIIELTKRLTVRSRARIPLLAGRSHSEDVIPQALELIARALRAGASLHTAMDAVATELPEAELAVVTDRVRRGLDVSQALDYWADGNPDRQAMAALLVLGHRSGAAIAVNLDRAAISIRQRKALNDEIRALTTQTRISGIVVAVAPAGFAILLALADREMLAVLVTTPIGLVSLSFGVVLEFLGIWWMNRLIRGVVVWE